MKFPKLRLGATSFSRQDHLTQVLFERQLSLLVSFEGPAMSILHLGLLQLEVLRRPPAGIVIARVGEHDTADIRKRRRDRDRFVYSLPAVPRACYGYRARVVTA
jgi:hypothetical protein